jgi:pyruvate/2-oxoglutarate/acetoin dehydrogenase E1 component/TPP-dependent pyruvate/acetoin dehydrogenase alpha subunit
MNNQVEHVENQKELSFAEFQEVVLTDYRIVCESREASLLGRKEVLTGKAKFGIFGDGKEVAQIAMAKAFKAGDFRSGYYRDQTFMMASGLLTIQELFAQLYAHADEVAEPMSAGRSMNGHFATHTVHKDGSWKQLTELKNSSADISPTAGQMPRLLGLAYASKVFRTNPDLSAFSQFSIKGNEVAFGTIGDASTSEGLFFETINAAGVLQVPLAMSVWDDGYGISVSTDHQTTKGNISKALAGFAATNEDPGYLMYTAKGWDYAELCEMYQTGVAHCRENHVPALFHITELTQPQGHSTSGSHERYKTKERLSWEVEFDCIKKMREWILAASFASETELEEIEKAAKITVREAKRAAWEAFQNPIKQKQAELNAILIKLGDSSGEEAVNHINDTLSKNKEPQIRDVVEASRHALRVVRKHLNNEHRAELKHWIEKQAEEHKEMFNSWLMSETNSSALTISGVSPQYADEITLVDGREIIRDNYDKILETNPLFLTFGEDSGGIGGVNQTLEGLQKKYGEIRVSDTGIREATIVGQGIGLALRGLRPIAEIQYLDYLLYALQILSDDLSTLRYRTKGNQKAPLIVSTRGHRLEGVWHSGSPLGVIIHALRGMYICVPRNMTQAAGFYNTLLAADDPALVIEPLNGYRIKERKPVNMGEFRIELGVPEILNEGTDLTLVTYGSCCRIAQEACVQLKEMGVSVELIDVQTLLPFDRNHLITDSLKKTGKLLIVDEDVPGGASGFMLQQILEVQGGFRYLDAEPVTLTAKEHRTAYGSDGDYFSKPSLDDIVETAYKVLENYNPSQFPAIY